MPARTGVPGPPALKSPHPHQMRDDSRDPLTSQDSPAFGPGLHTQEVPLEKSL